MPNTIKKIVLLTKILIKEQLKEPVAFIWILISPSAMFYFIYLSRRNLSPNLLDYRQYAAGYYGYVASSVALFGFAFYLIGRRECGFIRSFAYTKPAILKLVAAQLASYSGISILYCTLLYAVTKPIFGELDLNEFITMTIRFYICFLMFSACGCILVLFRLTFQNANTLISALSFLLLAIMVAGKTEAHPAISSLNGYNPMNIAAEIMTTTNAQLISYGGSVLTGVLITFFLIIRRMPINPVWSRY
jgi:ABC-2 type transport system permease protein